MRAFAIKNKEGKYLSIASQNYEHYWTTLDFAYYFRFLPNVDAKELADDFKNSRYPDCEVVEITIAEGGLEKENTMLRKALELACNDILINVEYDCPDANGDIGCPVGNKNNNFCEDCIRCEKIAEYIQQAKEELK